MLFLVKIMVTTLSLLGHYSLNHASESPLFIKKYKDNLPNLTNREHYSSSTKNQAKMIVDYLCQFIPQKKDSNIEGRDKLTNKLNILMENAQPISLILLGFPFKSTNYEKKCLSERVDMGEYLSLITLDTVVHNIKSIYPKTHCTIISDGLAYHIDDYDASYEDIFHYHEAMSSLIKNFPNLSFISWKINDTLSSHQDLQSEVLKIPCISNTADTERHKEMNAFVLSEFDSVYSQNSFLKKAQEQYDAELKNLKPKLKEQEIRTIKNGLIAKKSALIANELVDKGKQFSTFVSQSWHNYCDCIRLSVHCDKNNVEIDKKIPISLFYGHFGTPWHNALVVNNKKDEVDGFFKDIFKNKKEVLKNKPVQYFNVETKDGKIIALHYIAR